MGKAVNKTTRKVKLGDRYQQLSSDLRWLLLGSGENYQTFKAF